MRLRERAVDRGGQLGAPGAADVAEEALEDAEVGVADGLQRDAIVLEADRARHAQPRVDADQLQLLHADLLLIEREADRRGVLHA